MISAMSGLIAIVGRPNVGKSALFNRIVGRRIAIVHDQPGVTRDRVMAEAEWHGRPYTLVDTGGIGLLRREKAEDVITAAALQQVDLAIEAADVILFVVNVQEGIVPLDIEVAKNMPPSWVPKKGAAGAGSRAGARGAAPAAWGATRSTAAARSSRSSSLARRTIAISARSGAWPLERIRARA